MHRKINANILLRILLKVFMENMSVLYTYTYTISNVLK